MPEDMEHDKKVTASGTPNRTHDPNRGRILVHILVVIFGITSWSIINGLWVELPILVSHLPEGWTLPADLTIAAQFGNLGPLLFSFLVFLAPRTKLEIPASILIVVVLSLCALLYSFLWDMTATIGGHDYSVALLSLTVVQAIFAATTSQAYLAFMSHLKALYISSVFLGMSLSGLIPAIVASIQGSGHISCNTVNNLTSSTNQDQVFNNTWSRSQNYTTDIYSNDTAELEGLGPKINNEELNTGIAQAHAHEPSFSVAYFFLMLFIMGIMSLVALLVLLYHPSCQGERVDADKEENCRLMKNNKDGSNEDIEKAKNTPENKLILEVIEPCEHPANDDNDIVNENGTPVDTEVSETQALDVPESSDESSEVLEEQPGPELRPMGMRESWYLLFLLLWINAIQTSFLLAVQVYSSLPYGLQYYSGATRAENIVDPIACIITFFITAKTSRAISALTLLGTLLASYITVMAAMSPEPLLVDHAAGGILVVLVWILCTMVMVYAKVSIAAVMRSQGRLSLIWTGASTQAGSFVGALLAYVMVNHLRYFRDSPWCPSDLTERATGSNA